MDSMSYKFKEHEYKIKKMLGKGKYGYTYFVVDNSNPEKPKNIAFKIFFKNSSNLSNKNSFIQEKNFLNQIECENSVKIYECFDDKNAYYIAMELCDCNLKQLLDETKDGFEYNKVIEILKQLNNVLKKMHKLKKVHKDIKLENILVKYINKEKNEFIIKLMDYELNDDIKKTLSVTLNNLNLSIAPELIEREKNKIDVGDNDKNNSYSFEKKSDLWSIGFISYQLFFKKSPYNSAEEIDNNINIFEGSIKIYNFPYLKELIEKCLIKDPKERIEWKNYFKLAIFN